MLNLGLNFVVIFSTMKLLTSSSQIVLISMGGNSNVAAMFRKKRVAMDVLRVKEPGKQFSSFEYVQIKTWASTVMNFLTETLGLKSVQVLNGPMVDLLNPSSRLEFKKYFDNNEIVDLLIPRNVPAHRWKLRPSNV